MKIVIALGGNALLQAGQKGSFEEQMDNVKIACAQLAEIIKEHEVIITHGNGPQIGNIFLQNELARNETPAMPLYVCGAMTQGQIGYMLQQQLVNELKKQGIKQEVVTVVTQVVVDRNDPSFENPTKPIGSFYTKEEAFRFMKEKKEVWVEDSGRGWRKVVPSPVPRDIVEKNVIKHLSDVSYVVIASGGGGIPVVDEESIYKGIEAVIDKDLAGELLAELVGAEVFMCLTDVPYACLHYGQPNEVKLHCVNVEEMKAYEKEGHFAKGSMGPKVQAAIRFVQRGGNRAIITSLDKAVSALKGEVGTHIVPDENSGILGLRRPKLCS